MFNKLKKMAVSVATAGALLLTLGTGIAAAQGTVIQPTVDTSKPGNIHLTKYDNADKAVAPNGAESQTIPTGSNPLQGIKFTLTRVDTIPGIVTAQDPTPDPINLTAAVTTRVDNEKLKKLAALRAPEVEAELAKQTRTTGWQFEKIGEKTTDNDGQIDWTDLTLGVYLLQETGTTTVQNKSYKRSPASLVFLPTTHPKQTTWMLENQLDGSSNYAVWVYPKNSLEDNLKTVDDQNKQVGDTITYKIAASIPAVHQLDEDQLKLAKANDITERTYNLNNFGFWDNLNEKLQLTDVKSVKMQYTKADGTLGVLTADDDFVAKVYAAAKADKTQPGTEVAADTTDGGQKLTVALTSKGLQKVAQAKAKYADANVYLSFSPKVIKSGIVPNQVQLYKTYGSDKGLGEVTNPELPFNAPEGTDTFTTNTVVSAWGKLAITKKDDKGKLLQHAKFKLYGKKAADTDFNYGQDKELTVNGKKEFETDEHGVVTIDGLHATNLENNAGKVDGYTEYALVETEAPAGYELAREPFKFKIDVATSLDKVTADTSWQINADGVVTAVDAADVKTEADNFETSASAIAITDTDASLVRTVEVLNIKVKPRLPLTGGAGIAIFGILGAGLLLGGLYAAKRNS